MACSINTLFSMFVLYLLLQTGTVSAEDLGYLFAIEFIFAAMLIVIYLAKEEIEICCPGESFCERDTIASPLIIE